ncbi:tryptophan synthase subunit alpha [Methanocaldococcus villosus]|uniref:tryptophan synthase subunit alpha n=1 Tax=Methanocaldococcus villosus TaxID=667126 RepID=UPI00035E42A1|nr:tryptophan synthase subunit alpha [Methanocaldococcus villosus]
MKISEKFEELKKKGEKAFIAFYVAGDPNIEMSERALEVICKYADIVEIGIPFSDPVADGLTIQKADVRALSSGMTPIKAFEIVKRLNSKFPKVPKVFLTYYNIIFKMGEEEFVKRCKEVGVAGIIVPDLPLEESDSLYNICKKYGVDLIYLVAPTTTEERLKKILERASGFVYAVSVTGTTGEREKIAEETKELIKRVKKYSKIPVCVGFGISKKEHVEELCSIADGAIVGSAIVKLVEKYKGEEFLRELEKFVKELKEGTKKKIIIKN